MRDEPRRPGSSGSSPGGVPGAIPRSNARPKPDRDASASPRHPALRPRKSDDALGAFVPPASDQIPTATAPAEELPKPYVKRRKTARAARMRKLALSGLLLCVLGGGVGWAMTSPRLAVSGVNMSGVKQTPKPLLKPIAQALLGQNWLRADMAAARSRLLKLPTVQSATVSRALTQWPPRLSMSIQERQPWVRLGGGTTWWIVDRAGIAFRSATREDEHLYAVTSTGYTPSSQRVGEPVPRKVWEGVRRLAIALDESSHEGGRWKIRRAYLDRDNMASLRLQGGSQDETLVRLGDGMWTKKMNRARRALLFFEAAGRRAESLNLVSFSMPTWTPLQPSAPGSKANGTSASTTETTTPPEASAAALPSPASTWGEGSGENAGAEEKQG